MVPFTVLSGLAVIGQANRSHTVCATENISLFN